MGRLLNPRLTRTICLLALAWAMLAWLPWATAPAPQATVVAMADATPEPPEPPDLPAMPRAAAALPVFPQQFEVRGCVAAPHPAEFPGHAAARAPPCPAV